MAEQTIEYAFADVRPISAQLASIVFKRTANYTGLKFGKITLSREGVNYIATAPVVT